VNVIDRILRIVLFKGTFVRINEAQMNESHSISINDIGNLMSDLRVIAINLLANENHAESLRPSDLVQTALRRYKIKDQDWEDINWESRAHFFKCARMMMRRALIDHARSRDAVCRPNIDFKPPDEITPYNLIDTLDHAPARIVALGEALAVLENVDSELSDVVEQHYFFGSSVEDLAKLLDCAERTVKRRLQEARVFLKKQMPKEFGGKLG
jgi:RNA polymerase sigma factor (TIGR02999 family)